MAKEKKKNESTPEDIRSETEQPQSDIPETEQTQPDTPEAEQLRSEQAQTEQPPSEASPEQELLTAAEDRFLRLAAEYDNYRKRTAREKEGIWTEAKAQTVTAFLPVYDNLERALKQETADEAYKKGVEMTMKGLHDALAGLGVELIPALGEVFDPNRHNAVMHCDDPEAGESTIVEVFQQGFICGDKVIRFAMVKVAN